MSKLFRETPPLHVVLLILEQLGFSGLSDTKLFSIDEINLNNIDEWIPILEPYYLPCKSKKYFDEVDGRRIITILRHVLPFHGCKLQCYERLHLGKKRTVYQIYRATPRLLSHGEEISVMFL